jgi:hypothetical protein
MEEYEKMKELVHAVVDTDVFAIEDTGVSYILNHRSLPIMIELPSGLEAGSVSSVNVMAPLIDYTTPKDAQIGLQTITNQREHLVSRGYDVPDVLTWYDDGAEFVFEISTETSLDLVKIVEDFRFREDEI